MKYITLSLNNISMLSKRLQKLNTVMVNQHKLTHRFEIKIVICPKQNFQLIEQYRVVIF